MSHVRTQIRDAIAQACTGLFTTSGRVYKSRINPLSDGHEPALLIYTGPEIDGRHAMGGILLRQVTFYVHAVVSTSRDDVDDVLDQIAAEVEAAMGADPTLGNLAQDSLHVGSTPELDGQGKVIIGNRRMDFAVEYRTTQSNPETVV